MHSNPSRMKRAAIGLLAGATLAIGAVSTSGFGLLATQSAAAFPLADGGVANADAGAAGSVQIQRAGGQLTIVSLSPAPGWTPEIERQTGREVEVDFRNGDQRVQLNVELEDGDVRVRVRDRADDDNDDNDDNDDSDADSNDDEPGRHRGPGRGDDARVDNSGPSANAGHDGNDDHGGGNDDADHDDDHHGGGNDDDADHGEDHGGGGHRGEG